MPAATKTPVQVLLSREEWRVQLRSSLVAVTLARVVTSVRLDLDRPPPTLFRQRLGPQEAGNRRRGAKMDRLRCKGGPRNVLFRSFKTLVARSLERQTFVWCVTDLEGRVGPQGLSAARFRPSGRVGVATRGRGVSGGPSVTGL